MRFPIPFLFILVLCAFGCSKPEQNAQSAAPSPEGQNMFGHFIPRGLTINTPGLEPGYILFVPSNSAEVYLINREGEVVHVWKGNYGVLGAYLQDDGSLVQNIMTLQFYPMAMLLSKPGKPSHRKRLRKRDAIRILFRKPACGRTN
ncbi:MAG: hypothetical protein P8X57_13435 [Cyclobacteriaceae bacterium]